MPERIDPRITRTAHAFERAILELAAERPVSQITVADLADRAGVTRATFYNRYSSPLELLIGVLYADLELCGRRKEARWAEGRHPVEQVVRLTVSDVADHVDRFMAIYRHALHDPVGRGVYEALIRYFADRSLAVIARSADSPAHPDLPQANYQVIAQFFAHGFAGAIKAWLSDDSVTKSDLVDASVACAPAWWT